MRAAFGRRKRLRWEVDADVILRARRFDPAARNFCPTGCPWPTASTTLSGDEKRFVSQIQGRTYANVFGLVERFINAKVLELSHDHWFGDQTALEALVRFSDEELKHQALFRRIETMVGEVLPVGYRFDVDADAVARAVLGKSTWAVLALTLDIELFTQLHYRHSIDPDPRLSPVCSRTCSSTIGRRKASMRWSTSSNGCAATPGSPPTRRDRVVDDFIALVAAIDAILQAQASADAGYFAAQCGRAIGEAEAQHDRLRLSPGLSLAVHPLGRPASALRQCALAADHRRAGPAHPSGSCHVPIVPSARPRRVSWK